MFFQDTDATYKLNHTLNVTQMDATVVLGSKSQLTTNASDISSRLRDCSLGHKSCAAFASAARSTPCHLKELDMCNNDLHDAGVQQLSDLFKNPHCKLQKLV